MKQLAHADSIIIPFDKLLSIYCNNIFFWEQFYGFLIPEIIKHIYCFLHAANPD